METFAQRYCQLNPNIFSNPGILFVFFFTRITKWNLFFFPYATKVLTDWFIWLHTQIPATSCLSPSSSSIRAFTIPASRRNRLWINSSRWIVASTTGRIYLATYSRYTSSSLNLHSFPTIVSSDPRRLLNFVLFFFSLLFDQHRASTIVLRPSLSKYLKTTATTSCTHSSTQTAKGGYGSKVWRRFITFRAGNIWPHSALFAFCALLFDL